MARRKESVARKARRLTMTKGSVRIVRASHSALEAIVYGDSDAYAVKVAPGTRYCSCPAHNQCSHLLAVSSFWRPADEALTRWVKEKLQASASFEKTRSIDERSTSRF